MSYTDAATISALICLAALTVASLRRQPVVQIQKLLLLASSAGLCLTVFLRITDGWHADISTALWATSAATALALLVLSMARPVSVAYQPLIAPYLMALASLSALLSLGLDIPPARPAFGLGTYVHIGLSVLTYALITIASIATLAAFIKERALKTKRDGPLVRRLPPVVESERFVTFLLVLAEGLLLFGLMTGSILSYKATGNAFPFDHKTLLALLAFAVIGVLIILQLWIGMRGRLAARFVLIAWILLTLGYPGVKFVTDVLIG